MQCSTYGCATDDDALCCDRSKFWPSALAPLRRCTALHSRMPHHVRICQIKEPWCESMDCATQLRGPVRNRTALRPPHSEDRSSQQQSRLVDLQPIYTSG